MFQCLDENQNQRNMQTSINCETKMVNKKYLLNIALSLQNFEYSNQIQNYDTR